MKRDLMEFTVNVLTFSHVFNLYNSIFISGIIRSMELPSMKTDVSPTNNIENILFDAIDLSLMYKMKSSGPRTDPVAFRWL